VPVNVVARSVGTKSSPLGDADRVTVDGEPWPFSTEDEGGAFAETRLHFDGDLPAGALVEVFLPEATQPMLTFTIGADRDTAPNGGHEDQGRP